MSRKILKAAVRVNGKIYTGKDHGEAIEKARKEGKDVFKIDREKDGLFLLSDGKVITREQAKKEFGITHSEEIGKQGVIPMDKKKGRKFVIVTEKFSGYGYAFDKRNQEKGDLIIIARNPNKEKFKDDPEGLKGYNLIGKNMDGILDVMDLSDIMQRRSKMKDWYWIWDGNHSVKENELLRKEGFKIMLGGELCDKMENNREFGIKLAEQYGIPSPLWKAFKNINDGIKFMEEHEDLSFVFKPNGADNYLTTVPPSPDPKEANKMIRGYIKSLGINDFILQERKNGTEVELCYYCVKGKILSASILLESKRALAGDKGSMCGCAFDAVKTIPLDNKLVKMTIEKMKPFIEKNNFTGFADMNFIVGEGENEIWFLEWCYRFGENEHNNYFMNVSRVDMLNTLADMLEGTYKPDCNRGWGASITAFQYHSHQGVPIIVPEKIKDKCFLFDGMKQDNIIVESGAPDEELAVIGGYADNIEDAMNEALKNMNTFWENNSGISYRVDASLDNFPSSPVKRYKTLIGLGLI